MVLVDGVLVRGTSGSSRLLIPTAPPPSRVAREDFDVLRHGMNGNDPGAGLPSDSDCPHAGAAATANVARGQRLQLDQPRLQPGHPRAEFADQLIQFREPLHQLFP